MFLILHSIYRPNLPLLLEIFDYLCITIICKPGCDVIKFEIKLIFLIKLCCYMTKKSRQKLKYLENELNISTFFIFKGLSAAKICLRPESVSLIPYKNELNTISSQKRFLVTLSNKRTVIKIKLNTYF